MGGHGRKRSAGGTKRTEVKSPPREREKGGDVVEEEETEEDMGRRVRKLYGEIMELVKDGKNKSWDEGREILSKIPRKEYEYFLVLQG